LTTFFAYNYVKLFDFYFFKVCQFSPKKNYCRNIRLIIQSQNKELLAHGLKIKNQGKIDTSAKSVGKN